MNAGRLFVKTIFILITLVLLIGQAQSQTDPCPTMPDGYLCLPRSVAVKALEDADARLALEKQIKAQDEAITKYKDEIAAVRIEFARASGESTILKQRAVSDAALIELLMKQTRKKCLPLTVCF